MSATRDSSKSKEQRAAKIVRGNPLVDRDQMREAGKILETLESEGVKRRGYGISSPYDRVGPPHRTRERT
jgi:hypothetical protein